MGKTFDCYRTNSVTFPAGGRQWHDRAVPKASLGFFPGLLESIDSNLLYRSDTEVQAFAI
jgi:hypothetical protein